MDINRSTDIQKKLAGRLRQARTIIVIERGIHAFWPVWTCLFFVITLAWIGVFERISSPAIYMWVRIGIIATLLAGCIYGIRRFKWPTRIQARMRLDAATEGAGFSLLDAPAKSSYLSILWQQGQDRAHHDVSKVKLYPRTYFSKYDPYAIRFLPVLLGTTALFLVPVNQLLPRLSNVFTFYPLSVYANTDMIIEGWITPPSYTQSPPIYLQGSANNTLEVPEGSKITLRAYNTLRAPSFDFIKLDTIEDTQTKTFEGTTILTRAVRIELNGNTFNIDVIPDKPPNVSFVQQPFINKDNQLSTSYIANDDHRGGKATLEITAHVWSSQYNISVQDSTGFFKRDVVEHPYAGEEVTLKLSITDAIGQTTSIISDPFIMPRQTFAEPMARALVEQRKNFVMHTAPVERIRDALGLLVKYPDTYFDTPVPYMLVQEAIATLNNTQPDPDIVVNSLWEAAILLDRHNVTNIKEQLKRAQERLQQAIENGASEAEISNLMQELKQAIRNYLQALQQNPSQQVGENSSGQEEQSLTPQQLQQLLDQLEQTAQDGSTEQALQMLDMLRQLLESVQQGGNSNEINNNNSMSQKQDKLSRETFNTLRRQNGLNDNSDDTSDKPLTPDELSKQQSDLRDQLSSTDDATKAVEQAMRHAQNALDENNLDEAIRHQLDAIEKLKSMERQQRQDTQQSGEGRQGQGEQTQLDPLGRQTRTGQYNNNNTQGLDIDENQSNRARELTQDLRRRAQKAPLGSKEQEYIEQLLKDF